MYKVQQVRVYKVSFFGFGKRVFIRSIYFDMVSLFSEKKVYAFFFAEMRGYKDSLVLKIPEAKSFFLIKAFHA